MDPARSTLGTYWTQIDGLESSRAEDAWRWFVERYRSFVRDVLARFVGSANAEAATEDFWAYLFSSGVIQRADRTRRLRSFLVGVLRNYARDWLRKNRSPGAGEVEDEPIANDLVEDEELALWARSVLARALSEMHAHWPSSVEVLTLFYGLGAEEPLTVSETADRLHCSSNAVHQALHRGRKRLKHCIESELLRLVGSYELEEEIRLILGTLGKSNPGLSRA